MAFKLFQTTIHNKKICIFCFVFFKILFISFQRGRDGEREEEKHQCVVASWRAPHWGPGLQPRHVP